MTLWNEAAISEGVLNRSKETGPPLWSRVEPRVGLRLLNAALALGASRALSKPFHLNELLTSVRELLAERAGP